MSKNQKKIATISFLLLILIKVSRWFLFDPGNPIVGLFFSLIPYCVLGFVAITLSKSIKLALFTGFAILGADLGVDYLFRNSTDAQTPISIGFNYLIWLVIIFFGFFILNFFIKADPLKSEQ